MSAAEELIYLQANVQSIETAISLLSSEASACTVSYSACSDALEINMNVLHSEFFRLKTLSGAIERDVKLMLEYEDLVRGWTQISQWIGNQEAHMWNPVGESIAENERLLADHSLVERSLNNQDKYLLDLDGLYDNFLKRLALCSATPLSSMTGLPSRVSMKTALHHAEETQLISPCQPSQLNLLTPRREGTSNVHLPDGEEHSKKCFPPSCLESTSVTFGFLSLLALVQPFENSSSVPGACNPSVMAPVRPVEDLFIDETTVTPLSEGSVQTRRELVSEELAISCTREPWLQTPSDMKAEVETLWPYEKRPLEAAKSLNSSTGAAFTRGLASVQPNESMMPMANYSYSSSRPQDLTSVVTWSLLDGLDSEISLQHQEQISVRTAPFILCENSGNHKLLHSVDLGHSSCSEDSALTRSVSIDADAASQCGDVSSKTLQVSPSTVPSISSALSISEEASKCLREVDFVFDTDESFSAVLVDGNSPNCCQWNADVENNERDASTDDDDDDDDDGDDDDDDDDDGDDEDDEDGNCGHDDHEDRVVPCHGGDDDGFFGDKDIRPGFVVDDRIAPCRSGLLKRPVEGLSKTKKLVRFARFHEVVYPNGRKDFSHRLADDEAQPIE